MKIKHNYTQKELDKYHCTPETLVFKEILAKKGIEWLIEGLDDARIINLTDKRTKKSRRGQIRFGNKNEINMFYDSSLNGMFNFDNHMGYDIFNKIIDHYDGANLVITRTSGLFVDETKHPYTNFLLQGDTYKI